MNTSDVIINYLIEKYQPEAVIADHTKEHDVSVIGNVVLDVFVYPPETFQLDYNPDEFVQVFDGKIILDKSGIAAELQKRVLDYHWLLYDSLEIYYDIKRLRYHGPKKALRYMAQNDVEMFQVYSLALKELKWEYLSEWITQLKNLMSYHIL